MNLNTMHDLFLEQLKDVHSAEQQLVEALDKLADAADSDKLEAAFRNHRVITEQHLQRLERVFAEVQAEPESAFCKGIRGLIDEGAKFLESGIDPAVQDNGLIAAAQRCEHYEIAAYGTLRAFAQQLGLIEAVQLLEETLEEEKDADELLTAIAEEMNGRSEGRGRGSEGAPQWSRQSGQAVVADEDKEGDIGESTGRQGSIETVGRQSGMNPSRSASRSSGAQGRGAGARSGGGSQGRNKQRGGSQTKSRSTPGSTSARGGSSRTASRTSRRGNSSTSAGQGGSRAANTTNQQRSSGSRGELGGRTAGGRARARVRSRSPSNR